MDGLSGPIEFDEFGFRKRYILDVIEVAKKQMPQHVINSKIRESLVPFIFDISYRLVN